MAKDTSNSRATHRPRDVARNYPSYGWGCAAMREFMGFMADAKIVAPKGQLFLTLLPFLPNRGMNNAWEQVYLDAQRNPGRDTLQQSAKSKSSLPEGKGSGRLIVCRRPPHVRQRGYPVSYHPAGYYALKDNMISLSCMPIAYNMDTGTIMFNTAFKYLGGPKFGTGPGRGDERCLWPIATHTCPTCGANFPADLHIFEVEYDGIHAEWFCDVIRSQITAFFGVSAIQCASVDLSTKEIELFQKSVRGTLQGAIRFDMSVERLVSGRTGKDSLMTVEEFFTSGTDVANTLVKHYGSLFINCREKPVCFYARWSVHCRRAYLLCLQKA
eukprot:s2454_g4.t1